MIKSTKSKQIVRLFDDHDIVANKNKLIDKLINLNLNFQGSLHIIRLLNLTRNILNTYW
jgi:hypothetical protein